MRKTTVDRFQVLFVLMAVPFLLVILRLAFMQLVQREFWAGEAWKARTTGRTIPCERGWILDRRNRPLAITENTYDLRFIFGNYRKGSAAGQLGMIAYLLHGARIAPEEIYASPDPYLQQLLGLTMNTLGGVESSLKRDDLLFYLHRLLAPEDMTDRVDLSVGDPALPFGQWPSLAHAHTTIRRRIEEERRRLEALERELGLRPDVLVSKPGVFATRADARVMRRLGQRGNDPAAYRIVRRYHAQFDYYEEEVLQKIPHAAVMRIVVNEKHYPGFYAVESTERSYPADFADLCPNLIGKMGRPSTSHLARLEAHRQRLAELSLIENRTEDEMLESENLQVWLREIDVLPHEEIGVLGLERLLEPVLRGKRGYVFMERDRFNRLNTVLQYTPPLRGQDVVLTIDSELQRACERVLRQSGQTGAIVLMDLRSGAVLTLASWPHPERLEVRRDYARLASDPAHPLMNRAITGWNLPPPGSVFKLVTTAAALEEGRSRPDLAFTCERRMMVGRTAMKCEGHHGRIGLEEAIIHSCNIYFYHLSRKLDYETLFDWARRFGFGAPTGIFDPALYGTRFAEGGIREAGGLLKLHERGEANLMRLCIGQGAIDDVTPLQVTRMAAAFATGVLPRPYIISRIGDREIPAPPGEKLDLSPQTLGLIRRSMRQVVERGTARPKPAFGLDLRPYRVAGKTGTAQVAQGADHAWFAGFFPHDHPAVAFAIFVESCGAHGGDIAAPMLQRVLDQEETTDLLDEVLQ